MLTKYGRREWMTSAVLCATVSLLLLFAGVAFKLPALIVLSLLADMLWIPLALFFRDPPRVIPCEDDAVVSPADGVVRDIETVDCPFGSGQKFRRLGIFLSVLDVHINRMPLDLTVKTVRYAEGRFHDARSPLAPTENESNMLLCDARAAGREFPVIVKQISGAIARRIVCEAKPGDAFKRGDKFGMIKFGSRTELYLPDDQGMEMVVGIGDRVYAGSTTVARLGTRSRRGVA